MTQASARGRESGCKCRTRVNDTAYTLTPEAGGTRLHLRVSYRLTTDFNTYANWWAQALLDNFAQTVLQLYKTRLEGSA